MVTVERLKKFKIFHDAPPALLEKLSRNMTEQVYGRGAVICKEGESGGTLYLIASGSVAIEKKSFQADTGSKVVARLEAEEFFGEMAFLQGLPHSATVIAQEEATIFLLSRKSLDELVQKDAKTALDHVLTVSMGLSNRLRSTTRELVAVFEVARAVGSALNVQELAFHVVGQLSLDLGPSVSLAFYQWNFFNDEYALQASEGPRKDAFPSVLEAKSPLFVWIESHLESIPDLKQSGKDTAPLSFDEGHLVVSKIDMLQNREGLFLYHSDQPASFSSGERQMMETVSGVLAPALTSARHREEELARQLLQRSKQQGYSL